MNNLKKIQGFTLIELLAALAIVALLVTIAYPSYQASVRKGHRAEAQAIMLGMQLDQEKFRSNNITYGALADIGGMASNTYYNFSVSGNTATA